MILINVAQTKLKEPFRRLILGYFLIFTAAILILPSLYKTSLSNFSFSFLSTNLLIGLFSFIMIIRETNKNAYSLHLVHWIFHYTFFFIAPAVQYFENKFPWGFLSSNNIDLLVRANFVILIWQFIWVLQLYSFSKKKTPENNHNDNQLTFEQPVYHVNYRKINFVFLLSGLVTLYFIYLYGITGLFTRGSSMENSIGNSSLMLIVLITLRSIPVVLMALIITKMKNKKGIVLKFVFFLSLAMLLLTNFPSATARYWAAAVYIGLFLSFFKIKSKNLFVYMLIFGLNVFFPILGSARRVGTLSEFFQKINLTLGANIVTGDYDAFSSIAHTLYYIEQFGVTLGNQLMTVVLFFVPRSMWASKSVGSGYLVAHSINLPFDNISSPFPAEGLINFGIVGVILFSFLISRSCSTLDRKYWGGNSPRINLTYPYWIGFFFFIMRGDMLSSIAYLLGFSITFFLFGPKVVSEKKTSKKIQRRLVLKKRY